MKYIIVSFLSFIAYSSFASDIEIHILGIAQDAGVPHIDCYQECCERYRNDGKEEWTSSLAIVDKVAGQTYLIDATPNMLEQLSFLFNRLNVETPSLPNGIFITHAHIGHYTGLMYLGREAKGAASIPVYSMPRMSEYLRTNGPWSQLIDLENISIKEMNPGEPVILNDKLSITPFLVPHRDEYSETVGFRIDGPEKSALFIPDIDKWAKWEKNIFEELKSVDYAFIDGTFYDSSELPGRDMKEIPHPFITETMQLSDKLSIVNRNKIFFIHLNHSNPVLDPESQETKQLLERGYIVARKGMVFGL